MDRPRGTNQSALRQHNERLVLSLVRRHRALPRAEIARMTGLSPPTVSAIVRLLTDDGLLVAEEPQRGRVGQPSVPLTLHPEGVYSIGVKVGRRSADILLVDFLGAIRHELRLAYGHPDPALLLDFIGEGVAALVGRLPPGHAERVAGIGVAVPFELWNWEAELGVAPGTMAPWRSLDLAAEVARVAPFPVHLLNDATAACVAERMLGDGPPSAACLYVFVAWFIGGGVVVDGRLYEGADGYAGSIGQIPVPAVDAGGAAGCRQLLHAASVHVLDRMARAAGVDPRPISTPGDDWSALEPVLGDWIEAVAAALAPAVVSAVAVMAFDEVVIDGVMPPDVRRRIVTRVRERVDALDRRGLRAFGIREGTIGVRAPARGAASLPLLERFAGERAVADDGDEPPVPRPQRARPAYATTIREGRR